MSLDTIPQNMPKEVPESVVRFMELVDDRKYKEAREFYREQLEVGDGFEGDVRKFAPYHLKQLRVGSL